MADAQAANSLEEARTEYEEKLAAALSRQRGPENGSEQPVFTSFGTPLKALYGPGDVAELDYLEDLGFPGDYPFTRGIRPDMYRGRLWTMRQYAGFFFAISSRCQTGRPSVATKAPKSPLPPADGRGRDADNISACLLL